MHICPLYISAGAERFAKFITVVFLIIHYASSGSFIFYGRKRWLQSEFCNQKYLFSKANIYLEVSNVHYNIYIYIYLESLKCYRILIKKMSLHK